MRITHVSYSDRFRSTGLVRAVIAAFAVAMPAAAYAHVKWFVDYNLLEPPRPLLGVISSYYFVRFCLFVGPLIFGVVVLDRYLTRRECYLHRRAAVVTHWFAPHVPFFLRLGVSAFFAAVFVYACVGQRMILTPELHTHRQWICGLQIAIAAAVLFPAAAGLAGVGIVVLYAYGVMNYGLYHMLDYPIFLGVAAYLIIDSVYGERKRELANATLRVATGVTLLWASIEKFAFPEWSFMLMAQRPGMSLGFNPEFYMVAAGFVEFCAAYLLITGLLSARFAALMLLTMFVSAIVPFGRIDAVGHAVIIVVLLLLAFSNNNVAKRLDLRRGFAATATLHTSAFFATLLLFVALYYAGYYASYANVPA